MITLIKCLVYPECDANKPSDEPRYLTAKDFFPDPILYGDFRVEATPNEVLKQILPAHYLESYLDIKPWIVDLSKRRGYLDISEIESKSVDGTIDDLLNSQGFSISRRNHRLTNEQSDRLVESIMEGLKPDNIFGVFVSRENTRLSSRVYSDVLKVLGQDVSKEQVEQMFSAQYQGLEDYEIAQRQREAEDWSILGHQVVGGEVLQL